MTQLVDNFVFCPPPLGKPDPTLPRPFEGQDNRPRIISLPSKGSVCWYSVFNMLRPRIKAPNTEDLPERKFEMLASSRRKAITAHERQLPDIIDQIDDLEVKNILIKKTKDTLRDRLQVFHMKQVVGEACVRDFLTQEQCANLYDYLVYLKFGKRREIDGNFLKSLGKDPELLFEQEKREDLGKWRAAYKCKSWKQLSPAEKSFSLDNYARKVSAEKYGLSLSSWSPNDSFKSFVQELKRSGPLAINLNFEFM